MQYNDGMDHSLLGTIAAEGDNSQKRRKKGGANENTNDIRNLLNQKSLADDDKILINKTKLDNTNRYSVNSNNNPQPSQ